MLSGHHNKLRWAQATPMTYHCQKGEIVFSSSPSLSCLHLPPTCSGSLGPLLSWIVSLAQQTTNVTTLARWVAQRRVRHTLQKFRRQKRRQRRGSVWLQSQSLAPSDSSSEQSKPTRFLASVIFREGNSFRLSLPLVSTVMKRWWWTKLTCWPQLLVCLCRVPSSRLGWFGVFMLPGRIPMHVCLRLTWSWQGEKAKGWK